jgi:peptidoglycan/xylan/chitin deacetylase (PgdA/CDA1 family)
MVVVTFDDAMRSVLGKGLALMARLGVPGTMFVPTDFATGAELMTWSTLDKWRGTQHEEELRCMSWDEVRRLADAGWEIGSHTCSHPRLTDLDDETALRELRESRAACEEQLQSPCESLAYPFGAWDPRVKELVGQAGYRQAVTLSSHISEPLFANGTLALSRDGVYRWTNRTEFFLTTSPALRALRASHLYGRLRSES